ncbi:MAG: redox-sensing transcriptional repressor Rex [Armatimonadota bacterium]
MDPKPAKLNKTPTIRRLPAYLHLLRQLQELGWETVSGTYLADELKLDPVQVRKDLTITGIVGKPRVGFRVTELIAAIVNYLGWNNPTEALLVGVGNLGSALLGYSGFQRHGLTIVVAFDADPRKIDTEVQGKIVLSLEKLPGLAQRLHIRLGILAVPAEAAQSAAELMVAAGMKAIWNFTPASLTVPAGIIVQNEDLSSGLAVLSRRLSSAESEELLP